MGDLIVYDEVTPLPTGAAAARWWAKLVDSVGLLTRAHQAQRVLFGEAVAQWKDFAKAARAAGFPRRSRGARKHVRRLKAAERARR